MRVYDSSSNGSPGIGAIVRRIVSDQLFADIEDITNESSFIEDLGADSIDFVELITEFEDKFRIHIDDEDAERISTVGKTIAYIEKCLQEKEK